MTTFQRARSEEQREIRRRAILETAATMLAEMPVADISLNELSRRTGLAKSNVLRYFESREAILLELLDQLARDLFADLSAQVPAAIDAAGDLHTRVTALSRTLAATIARHETFCELLSVQAGVLEHNIGPETVARYKRASYGSLADVGRMLHAIIPELGDAKAQEAARSIVIAIGAYWTHAHPPQAVADAYAVDPSLVFLPERFEGSLARAITVLLLGTVAA